MERPGTVAIKTQIEPSQPKREITSQKQREHMVKE